MPLHAVRFSPQIHHSGNFPSRPPRPGTDAAPQGLASAVLAALESPQRGHRTSGFQQVPWAVLLSSQAGVAAMPQLEPEERGLWLPTPWALGQAAGAGSACSCRAAQAELWALGCPKETGGWREHSCQGDIPARGTPLPGEHHSFPLGWCPSLLPTLSHSSCGQHGGQVQVGAHYYFPHCCAVNITLLLFVAAVKLNVY